MSRSLSRSERSRRATGTLALLVAGAFVLSTMTALCADDLPAPVVRDSKTKRPKEPASKSPKAGTGLASGLAPGKPTVFPVSEAVAGAEDAPADAAEPAAPAAARADAPVTRAEIAEMLREWASKFAGAQDTIAPTAPAAPTVPSWAVQVPDSFVPYAMPEALRSFAVPDSASKSVAEVYEEVVESQKGSTASLDQKLTEQYRAVQAQSMRQQGFARMLGMTDAEPTESRVAREIRGQYENLLAGGARTLDLTQTAGADEVVPPSMVRPEMVGTRQVRPARRGLVRRWHAYPSFDRRVLEQRTTPSLSRLGVRETRFFAPQASYTPMSVHNATYGEARLPTMSDIFKSDFIATERLSVSSGVRFGASSATDMGLNDLQLGQNDPREKGFALYSVTAGAGFNLGGFLEFDMTMNVRGVGGDADPKVEFPELEVWKEVQKDVLAVRAMSFRTPFGIHNMRDPQDWYWLDRPMIQSRLFGPEGGLSALGVGVAWRIRALKLRLHGGVQNAEDEGMHSFLFDGKKTNPMLFEQRLGGRPYQPPGNDLFTKIVGFVRAEKNIGPDLIRNIDPRAQDTVIGGSLILGPNATGTSGSTMLLGLDVHARGPDGPGGAPQWLFQAEGMYRRFRADGFLEGTTFLPADTLHDLGFYAQYLQLYPKWSKLAAGLRVGYAAGSGTTYLNRVPTRRTKDPWRSDRWRIAPMLILRPHKALRIRVQWNIDVADHLNHTEHSIFISLDGDWGQGQAKKGLAALTSAK